jgi:CspA family cold shock protein
MATQSTTVHGKVKWFDARRGYGFILREGEKDLFIHYTSIQKEGFKSLWEGDEVEYEVEQGPKGLQASKVKLTKAAPRKKPEEAPSPEVK